MTRFIKQLYLCVCAVLLGATVGAAQGAQAPAARAGQETPGTVPDLTSAAVVLPAGYVIGSDDLLSIVFWRDKDLSTDVRVRPDGKVSLPLLNEIQAAGLTPEQLRAKVTQAAARFVQEPNATVIVKEIRSRQVFITGNVAKPGTYPLTTEMNVLQLIAQAGGVLEYADTKNIVVIRMEDGRQQHFKFNYNDVIKLKRPEQNIALKPGDTIVVP